MSNSNEDYYTLIEVARSIFNDAIFVDYEEREEYYKILNTIQTEEDIRNLIMDLNNRSLDRITIGINYTVKHINKKISKIINDSSY